MNPSIELDVGDVVDRLCQENAALLRRLVVAEASVAHLQGENARLRAAASPDA